MRPERRVELLLIDILERTVVVASSLERLGGADFAHDETIRSAVLWSLAMIGEASNRLPDTFQDAHPEIDWANIIGLRNFIMHAYERIDAVIVEAIARERVPELREQIDAILRAEYPLAARAVEEHRGSED